MQGAPFVKVFAYTQLLSAGGCALEALLVSRYSLRLGIPDRLFVIGTDALGVVLDRLRAQPFFVIAARLCPPGCEATLYACLLYTSPSPRDS